MIAVKRTHFARESDVSRVNGGESLAAPMKRWDGYESQKLGEIRAFPSEILCLLEYVNRQLDYGMRSLQG